MSEELLRALVHECLSLGESPQLLREENFVKKHFTDSSYPTKRPLPRYYLQWLQDGSPEPGSNPKDPKPYENHIEFFKEKGDEAFNVDEGGRFWYLDEKGKLSTSTFREPQNVSLLTYTEAEARKEAKWLRDETEQLPRSDRFRADTALKIKLSSIPGGVKDLLDSIAYVSLGSSVLNHTLGMGGVKGALSDKIVGQAIENPVAVGLSGGSKEEAIAAARNDRRLGTVLLNASDSERRIFDEIIANAWEEIVNVKDELGVTSARIDTSDRGKVDVHGVTSDGQKVDLHVKFNDEKRLFGLQGSKRREGVIQPGSKATDEYKRARNEIVTKLLPTAESYSAWWKAKFHARRKENKLPIDEKTMVPGTIEGPDKMFLTVLRRRGGEKVIGNNEMPMPWPSKENPQGDFIDPRALMKGQPKFISSAIHSVLTAQGEDKRQWLKLNFAKTAEALVDDIKDQIAGVDGNDVHYLNFKSSGSRVSLTVTSFVFPDPKKLHVSIEVPPNPRMARTFDVIVDDGEGNLYNPFFIEITSIVRGHPLQVHKTTRGTGLAPVEGMGDLSDFVGPRPGKSLQTNSRIRDGKIMREERANGRATALLREYIREVVITSNSTKRSTATTKHRRKR